MKPQKFIIIAIILIVFIGGVCAEVRIRPANWAQPVIGSSFKNWYKIDEHLYRSEQPSKNEFRIIRTFGIKAVLNLRKYHSDDDETAGIKLKRYHHKVSAAEINYGDIVKALRIIKNESGPILVHCLHGADRTGAVCAAYRIAFHNWSKEQAIDELINGGYGFHSMFDNIPELIRDLDVKRLKMDVFKP
jgi:protein tyrosine phosphatase (PTP) superfamily phosphohydrolase (DUF442 family)